MVIRNVLLQEDSAEGVPVNIIKRIVANKAALEDTLVSGHIRNNGQLGGSVHSFLNFFKRELEVYTDNPTEDNLVAYGREVAAIYLASELNTPMIKDGLIRYLSDIITDYTAMLKIEKLINALVLTDD
jgi:hypothetical protein